MVFLVLRKTAKGNLLLKAEKNYEKDEKPLAIERMNLFYQGRKAAVVFDSIGRVEEPFYLAKQLSEHELAGKTLQPKKSKFQDFEN